MDTFIEIMFTLLFIICGWLVCLFITMLTMSIVSDLIKVFGG